MLIRDWNQGDRLRCIEILRSNVPRYIAACDEEDFNRFLNRLPGPFFVVEIDHRVAACGGMAIRHPEPRIATLCWGMVDSSSHRRGVGRALVKHRLRMIETGFPSIERVRVNTTQLVQRFFEQHGFRSTETERNGYGLGLDRGVIELAVGLSAEDSCRIVMIDDQAAP
jgi:N-acetylglutamate synthase-like GNAT family acetyltransferase